MIRLREKISNKKTFLAESIRNERDGLCVMMEGLFNNLGIDIIDMTTIIPLFLSFLGANLQTIGAITTMRSVFSVVIPLCLGNFVAASKSKRNFSLLFNGTSRAAILLISLGLFLEFPASLELVVFFIVIAYYSFCQPLTGLAWNYLIGAHMAPEKRATLLGILYSVSGVLFFLSSEIIKFIRSNESLSTGMQYAWIFLIGGFFIASSVVWYIPLQNKVISQNRAPIQYGKNYIKRLLLCYSNYQFRQIVFTNLFSSIAVSVNTFFFIFVQDELRLSQQTISDLIIIQTLGVMVGGFLTGWISQRYSVKRMLQTLQILCIIIPIMGLFAWTRTMPLLCSMIALFLIGCIKSGNIGYTSYILEIISNEETVYYVVSRNLALIPTSFASIIIGSIIDGAGYFPIFIVQIISCLGACLFASRLQSHIFRRNQ